MSKEKLKSQVVERYNDLQFNQDRTIPVEQAEIEFQLLIPVLEEYQRAIAPLDTVVPLKSILSRRRRHASLKTIFKQLSSMKRYRDYGEPVLIRSIIRLFEHYPEELGAPSHNEKRSMLRLLDQETKKEVKRNFQDLRHVFENTIQWPRNF